MEDGARTDLIDKAYKLAMDTFKVPGGFDPKVFLARFRVVYRHLAASVESTGELRGVTDRELAALDLK